MAICPGRCLKLLTAACLAVALQPFPAFALDSNEIYNFDICRNSKPRYSDREVDKLTENAGEFPSSARSLGGYVAFVDRHNRQAAGLESCKFNNGRTQIVPHPITQALASVTAGTAELMAEDIESQRQMMNKGAVCASLWAKAGGGTPSKPESFQTLDGKSPSPADCTAFVNKFVPALQFRYKRMRQYLVLAAPTKAMDFKLEHDRPFTTFIAQKFVGTVWKSDAPLSRLSVDEAKELEDLKAKLTQPPKDLYFQTLSTAPILLHFTETPNADSINKAFQHLANQTAADVKAFIADPPQEMMLYTPYVLEAISRMPVGQRPEACQAVQAIYKNLKFRYESVPKILNGAALAFSATGAGKAFRAGGAAMAKIFMKRIAVSSVVPGGTQAANNLLVYLEGVSMCSSVAMERNMTPSMDGLCNVQRVNQKYEDAQLNAIVTASFGATVYGASRAIGSVAKVRSARKATDEANRRAAREFREASDDIH